MSFINDEACPFTEEELRRALALVYPSEQASSIADEVASMGRSMVTRRAADAAIARGSRDPNEIIAGTLMLPDFWFALLAALDDTLASRLTKWQQRARRSARRSRERQAMSASGLPSDAPPTPDVVARLAAEDATADSAWRRLRAELDVLLAQPLEARWRAVQRDAT